MNLKEARIKAGLGIKYVAEQAGVTLATVYMWESGRMYPRVDRFFLLADLYNVPAVELMKGCAEHKQGKTYSAY